MAVIVKSKKTGKDIVLLDPSEKGMKAAAELRDNCRKTNTLMNKRTKSGGLISLSAEERAYRAGYLQARKDNARAFNSKK